MIYLAELNEEKIAVNVKRVSEMIDDGNHIIINSFDDDVVFRKYFDGNWSEEKFIPDSGVPEESINEKLTRIELQNQENNLMQFEVLATIYEELLMKG